MQKIGIEEGGPISLTTEALVFAITQLLCRAGTPSDIHPIYLYLPVIITTVYWLVRVKNRTWKTFLWILPRVAIICTLPNLSWFWLWDFFVLWAYAIYYVTLHANGF